MNKNELHNLIVNKAPNICGICIYKKNEMIYEDYFNNYKKEDTTHIMSATKSIISLLYGIAIDKGFIKGVDEKVLSFFPDYIVKKGEKTICDITIRHLLTMRAPYKGTSNDPWTKVCSSENWTFTSLDFLGGKKGITNEFRYTTVCLHILSGILYKATGMLTVDFANKYLFGPLGIKPYKNFYAKTREEHKEFTISKEPKERVWFADPMGIGTPGYGLCMTADDMALIGLLCLNDGYYNNKQIISKTWISEMIKPRKVDSPYFGGMSYGYLWWIIDKDSYAASGNSGNVIYINKKENIVVSVLSYFKPTVFDRIDFIKDVLLKFIK